MAFTEKPPILPPPTVPVIDPRTGRMEQVWYDYFAAFVRYIARIGAAIP